MGKEDNGRVKAQRDNYQLLSPLTMQMTEQHTVMLLTGSWDAWLDFAMSKTPLTWPPCFCLSQGRSNLVSGWDN
ncbi:hypothetical protein HID58_006509 [Brassica napus]|uniref:Uncharacterized protein n=1 Tax=Brassica napus TaxID=3708 RepID=A0ABQ8ECA8_BRANA|nr:hypothetical protein HID58_006509 [Brassica napus]